MHVWLTTSLTSLDLTEHVNLLLNVHKQVKQEVIRTVILPCTE